MAFEPSGSAGSLRGFQHIAGFDTTVTRGGRNFGGYDFTPIIDPTFDSSFPCGLGHWLRVEPTLVV